MYIWEKDKYLWFLYLATTPRPFPKIKEIFALNLQKPPLPLSSQLWKSAIYSTYNVLEHVHHCNYILLCEKKNIFFALLLFWRSFLRVPSSIFSYQFSVQFPVLSSVFSSQFSFKFSLVFSTQLSFFLVKITLLFCRKHSYLEAYIQDWKLPELFVCSHQQLKEMSTLMSICSIQLSFFS